MAYRKNQFLLIYNNKNQVLVLKRNDRNYWELPGFQISSAISIKEQIQEFFSQEIHTDSYSIVKRSDVINRYELPKEFQSVEGVSGEEYRFLYVRAHREVSVRENSKYDDFSWINLQELPDKINIRNKEKIADKLIDEFNWLQKEEKEYPMQNKIKEKDIFDETSIGRLDR
mgnify:CR=1 FL=1